MGRYFDKFGIFDLDVSPNEEFDKYTVITSLPNVQVIQGLAVHRSGDNDDLIEMKKTYIHLNDLGRAYDSIMCDDCIITARKTRMRTLMNRSTTFEISVSLPVVSFRLFTVYGVSRITHAMFDEMLNDLQPLIDYIKRGERLTIEYVTKVDAMINMFVSCHTGDWKIDTYKTDIDSIMYKWNNVYSRMWNYPNFHAIMNKETFMKAYAGRVVRYVYDDGSDVDFVGDIVRYTITKKGDNVSVKTSKKSPLHISL